MKLIELIDELYRHEIKVWVDGHHLRYTPRENFTPELEAKFEQYRTTLSAYLRTSDGSETIPFMPLSSAQKRLWFLNQLTPYNAPTFNLKFEARLLSPPNVDAMRKALQCLVDRHESLRTTYTSLRGAPVQHVHKTQKVHFDVFDSSEWPRQQIGAAMNEAYQNPVDLNNGPIMRNYLFHLPGGRAIFWMLIPHLAIDFHSLEILFDEFCDYYRLAKENRALNFMPPERQYSDYIAWKLKLLAGEKGKRLREYFTKELLSGELPVLNLPTDRPRPPAQTFNSSSYFLALPESISKGLRCLAGEEQLSLFSLYISAFFVLLHRYSGQEDILVGSPRSQKGHKRFKGTVGYFENPLPVRADLSGNPSFRSFCRAIHQQFWKSSDHEDYPIHKLAHELHLERDAAHPPLFQAIFNLQEQFQRRDISPFVLGQGGERLEMDGLIMQSVGLDRRSMIFVDLQLTIFEEHNTCTGLWQYNSDLFDEQTIRRMGEHFQMILSGILTNPERRIGDIPLLTEKDRHKSLTRWCAHAADYPRNRCIHEWFEEQTERTPENIALQFNDQKLTYRELNSRANQLAHYLRNLGVGPDVLVGMYMERSIEMVVGILGIIKAGGAYVPMDTVYPQERITFMLQDCQASVVLTSQNLVEELQKSQARLVCLDSDWRLIEREPQENPSHQTTADNLIYSIYTSGSTGQPKGALLTHYNVARLFEATHAWFHFDDRDVWTLFHSYAFDFSVWELWGALLYGGKLIIVPYNVSRSPETFYRLLSTEQVTVLNQTPSAFRQLSRAEEALEKPDNLALRFVIFGGEALDLQSLRPWFERHGDTSPQLINMYGITETTVHVTYRPLTIDDTREALGSVIGVPIPDLQVYILDQYKHQVPIGVAGEMYVGGNGVARGYLNRSSLTKERFLSLSLQEGTDEFLYRTGDLARYLPNGDLEYLGRIDHQVKIRGFRIELGEIETAITTHPSISQAVVVVREDNANEKQLVSYIVPVMDYQGEQEPEQEYDDQEAQVAQWQDVFNSTYSKEPSQTDPIFNITGWNSSYTGQPIPERDMKEWVDETVKRICSFQAKKVLEIGCGTGMLLFRLASQSERYIGLDFSSVSLEFIHQQLLRFGDRFSNVTLFQKAADNLEEIEDAAFDLVLINSVIQYFPSIEYFITVIERGIEKISSSGGVIFIGDIRNHALLHLFCTSVHVHQAPEKLSKAQLQHRIQRQISHENELTIAPEFFIALKQHLPQITHVSIQPRRGVLAHEMTGFRYDAILYITPPLPEPQQFNWHDWQQEALSFTNVRRILQEEQPESLAIANIPNARLFAELRAVEWLEGDAEPKTVGEWRELSVPLPKGSAIDPEAFWKLEERHPYIVDISWAASSQQGTFDVLLRRRTDTTLPLPCFPEPEISHKPWSAYCSDPLRGKHLRALIPKLREHLQKRLPDYMVPSTFVMLDEFPLTPNGKVNHKALPTPERIRPELSSEYMAPRNELEERLAEIWCQVLDLERVGIRDDFFDLGGDSLTMTRMASRLRGLFNIDLSIAALFDVHTIAELAVKVEETLLKEIEAMSEEEAQRMLEEMENAENTTDWE